MKKKKKQAKDCQCWSVNVRWTARRRNKVTLNGRAKKAEENLITTCILGDSAKVCVRGWERQGRDTKKVHCSKDAKEKKQKYDKTFNR